MLTRDKNFTETVTGSTIFVPKVKGDGHRALQCRAPNAPLWTVIAS